MLPCVRSVLQWPPVERDRPSGSGAYRLADDGKERVNYIVHSEIKKIKKTCMSSVLYGCMNNDRCRDQVGPRDCVNHACKSQNAHNYASDGRKIPISVQNRPFHLLICVKMGACRP